MMGPVRMIPVALLVALAAATPVTAQAAAGATDPAATAAIAGYFAAEGAGLMHGRLATLCDRYGPRQAGSSALEAAIDWQADRLREEGFEVTLQNATISHWVRGSESATIVHPLVGAHMTAISLIGLGFSGATGPEGVQAEVVVVDSPDALLAMPVGDRNELVGGKIVLINQPYEGYNPGVRYAGPMAVKEAGGLACLIRSIGPFGIKSPHTGSSERGLDFPSAAVSIADAMRLARMYERGDAPVVKLVMDGHRDLGDVTSRNIIADWKGSESPEEFVLISGHFDSWDVGCGVMDDAGGAYLGWMALSALRALGLRPRRTVRAVMWTSEEVRCTIWRSSGNTGLPRRARNR